MSKVEIRLRLIVSLVLATMALLNQFIGPISLDKVTFALLIAASVPWLGFFFESVRS